jgi:uncharacterized protein with HEPN domain
MRRAHPERVPLFLDHILEAISRIESYVSGMDRAAFNESLLVQDGVIRNFENIGEASNRILTNDPTFEARYPDFPLHLAYGMRNALAHGYDKVVLETVWTAITDHLPALKASVLGIRESMR